MQSLCPACGVFGVFMSDKKSRRNTPPEEDEWPDVWDAIDKANMSWIITGPIHAVVSNWKALVVIAGVIVWLNNDRIIEAIATIIGAAP